MRTLLIPTDFKVKSLNSIPHLLQQYESDNISLLFVHMMKLTDSEQELLMLSRRSNEYRYISDEFYQACASIKRVHPQVYNIRIEFFYGSTLAVFKNFVETNEVDNIVMLNHYPYEQLTRNSIAPSVLVNRSGLPVISADWHLPNVPVVHHNEEYPDAAPLTARLLQPIAAAPQEPVMF